MILTSDTLRLVALLKAGGLHEYLVECAGAARYQVLVFNEDQEAVKLTAALVWPPDWEQAQLALDGPLARLFESGQQESLSVFSQPAGDADWIQAAQAELRGLGEQHAFPLRAGRKFIGVLLAGGPDGQPLAEPAARGVALLCRQLGAALAFRSAGKAQELLGSSSSGLAHDLKGWLTPIRTCLQLWEAGGADAAKAAELRGTALKNLEVIQACLEQARYYAQHHQPRFQWKKLAPLLRRSVALVESFTSPKRVTLVLHTAEDLAAEVDELLMLRLLNNLLSNAIRAAPDGARIELDLAPLTGQPEWLRLRIINPAGDGQASGDGPPKRWGLGLQICREIAALHGGRLSLAPADGAPAITAQFDWPVRRPVG